MSRRAAPFRQIDIIRALRGAAAAGVAPMRVEIDVAGKIVIVFADAAAARPESDNGTTSEEELQWAMSRAAARRAAEREGATDEGQIKYVQRVRKGDTVHLYFRKGNWREGPLTSLDGSVALREEVNAILKRLEGEAIAAAPKGKTLGDALLRYSGDGERRKPCADFLSLAPSTQVEYLRMANEIRAHYGAAPLRIITPAKVLEMRDDWAPRGYKATNDRLQVLKNALKPALLDKRVKCNAFEGVADMVRPHYLATPNLPWENDEVAAGIAWCLEREQPGLARAIGLGRWGGFRRGTICHVPSAARRKKTGPKGEIGPRIVWITEKRKVLCDRREDPRLTALIDSTPNKALTIAYNADGAPWKERQLNQAFDRMIADLAKRGLSGPT